MTTHDDRYPELPSDMNDSATQRVVEDLDTLYAASAPPPHLQRALDDAIYQRLAARQSLPASASSRWRTLDEWRKRRRVIFAAALVAALIVGGGAYAASSLVDQMLAPVVVQHGQNLALTQSGCGFTMTVTRAYADATRIIIGYTISGPSGRTFVPGSSFLDAPAPPTLTDSQGRQLLMAISPAGLVEGTTEAQVLEFDAGAIAGTTSQPIPLHLSVPYLVMTEQTTSATADTPPCESHEQGASTSQPGTRLDIVKGPFNFDLSVPPSSDMRVANVQQTADADGEQVTLERVVVTPTDTQVFLRRGATIGKDVLRPQLTIGSDGGTAAAPTYEAVPISVQTATGTFRYYNNVKNPAGLVEYDLVRAPSLYDDHSQWTLVVPVGSQSVTFRFTVP